MTVEEMTQVEVQHGETVGRLLSRLDDMDAEEWRTVVRWAAPRLCDEEPTTLISIIGRRAVKRAAESGTGDVATLIGDLFEEVGLRLTVDD